MIGQCLSNKNESATVSKTKIFYELNKAYDGEKLERKIGYIANLRGEERRLYLKS